MATLVVFLALTPMLLWNLLLAEGRNAGSAMLSNKSDKNIRNWRNVAHEMILDGHFYQVHTDGSVREVGDSGLSPFAITAFSPGPQSMLAAAFQK